MSVERGFLDELAEQLDVGAVTMAALTACNEHEYDTLRRQPLRDLPDASHPMWDELLNFTSYREAGATAARRAVYEHVKRERAAAAARRKAFAD